MSISFKTAKLDLHKRRDINLNKKLLPVATDCSHTMLPPRPSVPQSAIILLSFLACSLQLCEFTSTLTVKYISPPIALHSTAAFTALLVTVVVCEVVAVEVTELDTDMVRVLEAVDETVLVPDAVADVVTVEVAEDDCEVVMVLDTVVEADVVTELDTEVDTVVVADENAVVVIELDAVDDKLVLAEVVADDVAEVVTVVDTDEVTVDDCVVVADELADVVAVDDTLDVPDIDCVVVAELETDVVCVEVWVVLSQVKKVPSRYPSMARFISTTVALQLFMSAVM